MPCCVRGGVCSALLREVSAEGQNVSPGLQADQQPMLAMGEKGVLR